MWPAIHTLCIRSSDVTEIENQLPKDGVSSHSTFGSSPLHFACLSNSFQIVKYLVSNGADVNARNENGETPLHFTAKQSSKEIVQYLVDHGADPMLIDKDFNTPLHWAAEDRDKGVIDILRCSATKLCNNIEHTPLETAIFYGNMAAVQALLDDLDANSLCCAAESNQVEIVKYLARQPNVHISAKGRKGKTALQLALELGHHDIGKFLSKCHAASRIRSSTPIKFLTSFHTHRPQTVNVHTL